MSTKTETLKSRDISGFVTKYAIYIVLVVLVIGIAIYDPRFLSVNILRDILLQSSTRVIIALGAAFILSQGERIFPTGRIVGLTAVISASMLQTQEYGRRFFPDLPQLPLIVPILIAIAAGLLVGLINGIIVAKFKVPPFIATLGTMVAVYGANSLYFDMKPNQSQPIGGLRPDFSKLGTGAIGTRFYLFHSLYRHYRNCRIDHRLDCVQQNEAGEIYVRHWRQHSRRSRFRY